MKKFAFAAAAFLAVTFSAGAAMASSVVAKVNISTQTMTVTENGFLRYTWKVSTAGKGYVTPVGRYTAKWASLKHRSRKYNNAPMPYAIFYNGGYAVHATFDLKRLGRPASHGCVRLHPENAAQFFALAHEAGLKNTRIEISH